MARATRFAQRDTSIARRPGGPGANGPCAGARWRRQAPAGPGHARGDGRAHTGARRLPEAECADAQAELPEGLRLIPVTTLERTVESL
ncbi:hypothetical protein ACWDPI_21240, partial [Streptomyces zhihengii]